MSKRSDEAEGYYHVCTDGHAIPWMFQDDGDFIAGVNRIALCVLKIHVQVIDFILMDNHVHFLLYGYALECKKFINRYKMLTGRWIANKYGLKDYLRLLPTEMIRIEDEENLLNALAYIDRNSIVAGYKYMPCEYPWGAARYMFCDNEHGGQELHDLRTIGSMSVVERRSFFKTKMVLPEEWRVDNRGMIYPGSFMDFGRMEQIFRSSLRYSYFLAKKLEGTVEMQFSDSKKVFLPDKELRDIVKNLARQLFGNENIRILDMKSRIVLAKRLRYDYAATVKQISRMVYLDGDLLNGFV